MQLLVIESDKKLARRVAKALNSEGYQPDLVPSVAGGKALLRKSSYRAIVLGLADKGKQASVIVRNLRREVEHIPLLVISAFGGVSDRVNALRSGADDYLAKPFSFEEFVARVQALLRRPNQSIGNILSIANVTLDTESRQAFIDNEPQLFSAREIVILELFMRQEGRVVSKRVLENHVFRSPNAIEVHIHRLRKKLNAGKAKCSIISKRNIGYVMVSF